MTATSAVPTVATLLVEDDPGDAGLVRDMLERSVDRVFAVVHVERLAHAGELCRDREFDVVLLDLSLPDASGVEAVDVLRRVARELPIVVLTGADDDALALRCLDAGAQDYLRKDELRPVSLQRSIGYSITRLRERQLRELREEIDGYRQLSSSAVPAPVTARLAGAGPLRERHPQLFGELVARYHELLVVFVHGLVVRSPDRRPEMQGIVAEIGLRGGGARDLVDLHVAALDAAVRGETPDRSHALAVEGRLMALETMGLLVEFYRLGRPGSRRRVNDKELPGE
ncbi:MAG: response regulator [Ilumatobacteraceae bacterium]